MINVELLKRTLAHIEAHPETWDQTAYRRKNQCGTAFCFAGWAAELSGVEWDAPADMRGFEDEVRVGGQLRPVSAYAAELLGIEHTGYYTEEDGWDPNDVEYPLFQAGNDLEDLRRMVAQLCAESEPS